MTNLVTWTPESNQFWANSGFHPPVSAGSCPDNLFVCVCVCLFVRVKAGPHVEVVFLFIWLSIGRSQAEAVYAVLCFVIWDQLYQVPNALCVSSSSFLKFRSYSVTMVLIVSHCSITLSGFVFPFSSLVSTNLWTNQTVLEIYYWLYFIF